MNKHKPVLSTWTGNLSLSVLYISVIVWCILFVVLSVTPIYNSMLLSELPGEAYLFTFCLSYHLLSELFQTDQTDEGYMWLYGCRPCMAEGQSPWARAWAATWTEQWLCLWPTALLRQNVQLAI